MSTRRISLSLNPGDPADGVLQGHLLVAIDVLRASTTICKALSSGAREILPVADVGEAKRLAESLGRENSLLCGERDGMVIPGFDLGNSPLEFVPNRVRGKTLVMCTTNGTALLSRLREAEVYIAGFVNAGAVIRSLGSLKGDVAVFCAGLHGGFSLEDAVCGGTIVAGLEARLAKKDRILLSDGALAGKALFQRWGKNPKGLFKAAHHARYLASLGFERDLVFAARMNSLPVVPVYREGRITLNKKGLE
jgi:2-phosphosulfolactate phosphatase